MKPRVTIGAEELEKLRAEIVQAPPASQERFTKAEAVRRLRPDLQAMRERGYSLKAIAEFLSDRGLRLAPTVLSSYLWEAKEARENRPKRRKGPARAAAPAPPSTALDAPAASAPNAARGVSREAQAPKRTASESSTKASPSTASLSGTEGARHTDGKDAATASAPGPATAPTRRKFEFEMKEDSKKL